MSPFICCSCSSGPSPYVYSAPSVSPLFDIVVPHDFHYISKTVFHFHEKLVRMLSAIFRYLSCCPEELTPASLTCLINISKGSHHIIFHFLSVGGRRLTSEDVEYLKSKMVILHPCPDIGIAIELECLAGFLCAIEYAVTDMGSFCLFARFTGIPCSHIPS